MTRNRRSSEISFRLRHESSENGENTVFQYLRRLKDNVKHLFEDMWSCQVIFEMLSPLCQTYVLRLLCLKVGMPIQDIDKWCLPNERKNHKESLKTLVSLKILISDRDKNLLLHEKFRTSLQKALCASTPPFLESDDKVAVAEIVNHANRKWDSVLNAIVPDNSSRVDEDYDEDDEDTSTKRKRKRKRDDESSSSSKNSPREENKLLNRLLLDTNMLRKRGKGNYEITKIGYEFMLMGRHMQAWRFVRAHLNSLDEVARIKLLMFIFRLRFCVLGKGYEIVNMTADFKKVLKQFDELGLLKFRSKLKRFYPTQLVIDLVSRSSSKVSDTMSKTSTTPVFQVIVETNFHVTAYTSSPLHIRMLALFVDLHTRLPNMVHGTITRFSVSEALRKGVGARHMKAFLELYAHPSASKTLPVIPTNIVDQLFLWEQDQNRVTLESGALLRNFKSDSKYKAYADIAEESGYLLFRNDAKRTLVVVPDGLQYVIQTVRKGGQ